MAPNRRTWPGASVCLVCLLMVLPCSPVRSPCLQCYPRTRRISDIFINQDSGKPLFIKYFVLVHNRISNILKTLCLFVVNTISKLHSSHFRFYLIFYYFVKTKRQDKINSEISSEVTSNRHLSRVEKRPGSQSRTCISASKQNYSYV